MISPGEVILHRSDGLEHLISCLARPLAIPCSDAAQGVCLDAPAPAAEEECSGPCQDLFSSWSNIPPGKTNKVLHE